VCAEEGSDLCAEFVAVAAGHDLGVDSERGGGVGVADLGVPRRAAADAAAGYLVW
jgi:hypothetical protein